jgi:hypothetical protein
MKLNSFDIIEHYKGCQYIVLTTALHTETNEEMVIYKKCVDSQSQVFARPLKMFDANLYQTDVDSYIDDIAYSTLKAECKFKELGLENIET